MSEDSKTTIRISHLERALGGKYKILGKIGVGGFGEVYLGEHAQLRRKVAIKILLAAIAGQTEVVIRFEREARAAATLSHPNIIDIYDVGEADDIHYFVMKYVDGETLSQKMQREKKVSPNEVIHIMRQVADALDYAHQHDIIHRDIKPANVMLDEYGKPVLMDFGVARVQFEGGLTKTGTLMGTPHYLPPELPLGKKVDGRSDIYSLGIMMYEMLAGRPPYHDENSVALIFKHINEPPDPLKEVAPELDEGLCKVVHKMIEKSPENRYQNAGDVADALAEFSAMYPPVPSAVRRSTPGNVRNTEKLLILAQEHLQQQKLDKAIEIFATIMRRDPSNETAKREIADLIEKISEQIREHIGKKEFSHASDLIRQAIQVAPKNERLSQLRQELEEGQQALNEERETPDKIEYDAPKITSKSQESEEKQSKPSQVAVADALISPPITPMPAIEKNATEEKEDVETTGPITMPARVAASVAVSTPAPANAPQAVAPAVEVPVATPASPPVSAPVSQPATMPSASRSRLPMIGIVVAIAIAFAGAYYWFGHRTTPHPTGPDPALLHQLAESRIKNEQTPEKPVTGEVSITSTPPGAKVFVGADEKGVTPLTLSELPLGKYALKLQLKGYQDMEQEIDLTQANPKTEVPFVLEAATPVVGTLVIESNPEGAFIVLNSRVIGVTPKKLENTNAGKYNITLKKDGYQDHAETVRVKDGQTATLNAQMIEIPKPVVVQEKPKEPEVKPGMLVSRGPDVTDPKAVKKSSARYPDALKNKKVEGTVRMEVLVSETGKVIDVKVVQSVDSLLDQAAAASVREWIFEPAKKQGIPVKVWYPVSMSFVTR